MQRARPCQNCLPISCLGYRAFSVCGPNYTPLLPRSYSQFYIYITILVALNYNNALRFHIRKKCTPSVSASWSLYSQSSR